MSKFLKITSFGTMAVLIAAMMAATVLEKLKGSPEAFRLIYHSPLFMLLWALAAVSGLILLFRTTAGKRAATALIHLSFALILCGALVTHLTGKSGTIHLREGEPSSLYTTSGGEEARLPFSLTLQEFSIENYSGSQAAADYASTVLVEPSGDVVPISMNHIGRHGSWRLCQAGYDPDGRGSTLSLSHDPWGIAITYAGYLLLLLSMAGFFFQKNSGFRRALASLSGSGALALCLLLSSCGAHAAPGEPKVLPEEVASSFSRLYVYYNDRICPFETLARDYCMKAYGKPRWKDYSAEQIVTGWLFYYDWWEDVPFKLKASEKGGPKEAEKDYIRRSVASGSALKIYPIEASGSLKWYDCNEALPEEVLDNYELWVFIRKVMDLVAESVRQEDWPEAVRIVDKIAMYQRKTAGEFLPSDARTRAEKAYNRLSRPMVPFMASITLGLLLFVLYGILLSRGKQPSGCLISAVGIPGALLLAYVCLALGLRWFVSGHAPLSGSWCVMMLMAGFSSAAILALRRRFPLIQPLGLILAGFNLLVASLSGSNPQITPLMPVLQSPLLSLHVLSMMLSYTLFGLTALNGILALAIPGARERLRSVSLVILCPAVFILALGTFLGAVWANVSWGSYWSWDPKETWALITLLVYAAALHSGSLRAFRRPLFFHIYTVLAFLTVLITYFGVNLLLGGMHSYA